MTEHTVSRSCEEDEHSLPRADRLLRGARRRGREAVLGGGGKHLAGGAEVPRVLPPLSKEANALRTSCTADVALGGPRDGEVHGETHIGSLPSYASRAAAVTAAERVIARAERARRKP
jgi:hypothetical protein